jgi:hypothetical protein
MKLLCGDDDDRLWDISRAVQIQSLVKMAIFCTGNFQKARTKISNSISCGGGGRNGPETARTKSYSYSYTFTGTYMCSNHRPDMY